MNKTTEALKLALETADAIAKANWKTWEELATPEEFERWAKSRANHMASVLREALADHIPDATKMVAEHKCGGCAKTAADGWALYCVECWEKAEPVKQEPEYWEVRNGVCKHGVYRTKEQAEEVRFDMQKSHDLSGSLASFNVRPLYAAPVDAKAIREQALEEAAKFAYKMRFRSCWTAEAIADGIRGMK